MTSKTEQERQGRVEQSGDDYVIHFERRLDHPIESVWLALTEPKAIEKWLAAVTTFELREGGTVELHWRNSESEEGMRATITELDPPRLLEWSGGPAGNPAANCRWELSPDGDATVLTFTARTQKDEIDRKAADDPEHWSPPSMLSGWHFHLGYLADTLDGKAVAWDQPTTEARFRELFELYGGKRR